MKFFLFLASLFVLGLITITPVVVADQKDKAVGDYIVVLKEDQTTDSVADEFARTKNIGVDLRYTKALKGFSARIPSDRLAEVKGDPRVKFVSENRIVNITSHNTASQILPTGINRIDAETTANKGTGVGVAVIDTGIDLSHPDLKINILANKNCVRPNRSGADDNGHGTHVAGTIAALSNSQGVVGVAPEAKLMAVKVLNSAGSGTWAQVICGLDWAVANSSTYNIKVINLSLGGGGNSDNNCGNSNFDALHQAICRVRDAGITTVVAAGNSNQDSAASVPAAYDDAVITVSALVDSDGLPGGLGSGTSYGADDTFASFSNFGSVVDLAAPGVNIYSTWRGGGYKTISGTSMATPHVSGAAVLYLKNNPGVSWIDVRDGLKSLGEGISASTHTDPSGKHSEPVVKAI